MRPRRVAAPRRLVAAVQAEAGTGLSGRRRRRELGTLIASMT